MNMHVYIITIMSVTVGWVKNFTSAYDVNNSIPRPSIITDPFGNIFVVYASINPPVSGQTNTGKIDICILKLDSDGQLLWCRQQPSFNTIEDDISPNACVDTLGNLYVTYATNGSISGQTEPTITVEVVVFKMNQTGDTLWIKQSMIFNTTGPNLFPQIGIDESNNVYVAYQGANQIIDGIVVVFKLDTDGNFIWKTDTIILGFPEPYYTPSITVDESGNSYISYCSNSATPVTGGTVTGSFDIIVFKLDTNGAIQWVSQKPTFNTDQINLAPDIAIDSNRNVYVVYESNGTASGQVSSGSFDIIVFKLSPQGETLWVSQKTTFNTSGAEVYPRIRIGQMDMIYLVYTTSGVISGQTLTGSDDVVITILNNDGDSLIVLQQPTFNTIFDNVFPELAVDQFGHAYIAYYSVNTELVTEQNLIIFKIINLICVLGNTKILLSNGTIKPIKEIQRGDMVVPNHQVAMVCRERLDYSSKIDLMVFEKNCLGNQPNERLIITPNHPIFYKNARRPAKCFAKCPGVSSYNNVPITKIIHLFDDPDDLCLYDLQFDHDGSYIANGTEIQSRSPYSCFGPLPKNSYYNQSLYSSDTVWDSMDQVLPLDSTPLKFNLVMLKNKRHYMIDSSYQNNHSITKYQ